MSVELTKQDIKGIIRRRRKTFLITFFCIFLICLGVALYLPPIYRSESTIIIENQDIPEDFVKSTITTYINERLYMLQQKLLSREELIKIIRQHNLYEDIDSTTGKVEQMREDINVQTVDTAVVDERSGRAKTVTVAFKLSYEGKKPHTVVQVANLLANYFVDQDTAEREVLSSKTTDFLEKELENFRKNVAEYEKEISMFKAAHINELPGSIDLKFQNMRFLSQELERIDTRIRTLREKNIYLETQITNVEPLTPVVSEDGKLTQNPADRLKYLRLQLVRLQARLSPKHPDIIAIKREIAELEGQVDGTITNAEKMKLLQEMENGLIKKRNTLGQNHPDVIRAKKELDALSSDFENSNKRNRINIRSEDVQPDNPGYLNLKAQILAANAELQSLLEEKRNKTEELKAAREKLEIIPLVEQEYNGLTLNYESAKGKYNEILDKLFAAKLAQTMDTSKRGERFEIVTPAYLPEKPSEPNRIAIILFGFVLGVFVSLGLSALGEGRDQSIKSSSEIETIGGIPVIATLSIYETNLQKRQKRFKIIAGASLILLLVVGSSALIDCYLTPLDTLWETVSSRLSEMGLPLD
ncbi:chain-length determining protein [Desulfosarcina ovata subsp. sediminis]|uniref:Chain-length determining protein n=1 Tax=Desulfosarcina ovata subsp. sediminis TaxID=885957 RepID=A0A5K7ZQM7_9BACT|nr:hypothetical protein [Desulfosarcina ovata]BBO82749.1 chain-length determining protein [Desulfosarcina ovata subsp. sediminis]